MKHYHAAIVCAGSAGTDPLVYGAWSGRLKEPTGPGLAIIESGARIGHGRLGRYRVNSNSTGATFIESREHEVGGGVLRQFVASPARDEISRHRDEVLPLSQVEPLLQDPGRDLEEAARLSERSEVYLNTRAEEVRILGPGRCEVAPRSLDGAEPPQRITASRVSLATDGNPRVRRPIGAIVTAACAERCPGPGSPRWTSTGRGWRWSSSRRATSSPRCRYAIRAARRSRCRVNTPTVMWTSVAAFSTCSAIPCPASTGRASPAAFCWWRCLAARRVTTVRKAVCGCASVGLAKRCSTRSR